MARAMKEEIGNLASLRRATEQEADVRWLQTTLNEVLGLSLAVDGIYGETTRAAVIRFQQMKGLQADGVAGPITRQRLSEVVVI
jgi:peptidoglycan hydrolase-like protein with peptidoglycan-binding domain